MTDFVAEEDRVFIACHPPPLRYVTSTDKLPLHHHHHHTLCVLFLCFLHKLFMILSFDLLTCQISVYAFTEVEIRFHLTVFIYNRLHEVLAAKKKKKKVIVHAILQKLKNSLCRGITDG